MFNVPVFIHTVYYGSEDVILDLLLDRQLGERDEAGVAFIFGVLYGTIGPTVGLLFLEPVSMARGCVGVRVGEVEFHPIDDGLLLPIGGLISPRLRRITEATAIRPVSFVRRSGNRRHYVFFTFSHLRPPYFTGTMPYGTQEQYHVRIYFVKV